MEKAELIKLMQTQEKKIGLEIIHYGVEYDLDILDTALGYLAMTIHAAYKILGAHQITNKGSVDEEYLRYLIRGCTETSLGDLSGTFDDETVERGVQILNETAEEEAL